MDKSSRIYVAGHTGLVGSAIVRRLTEGGYSNLILRERKRCDLTNRVEVQDLFDREAPEYVFLAAAKVGGILANATEPVEFLADNLAIQTNVIDMAFAYGVTKLLFLGSSCIYPRDAKQPIQEEALMTGPLEATNEAYAIAKIAGIKLCQAYRKQYGLNAISLMPCNLYGPGDNFDLDSSHVIPALIRKMHEAKMNGSPEVAVWGTGTPRREFLHVNDLADAAVLLMERYDSSEIVNVGSGREIGIGELVALVRSIVGYQGKLVFDLFKPDGTPRKLLDSSKLRMLGWAPRIELEDGIRESYSSFLRYLAYFSETRTRA